eukprot:GCRY01005719.1.p1 GENE.GCRY01005719.1~~GCRY01005719.1.p1  ORF type:complete len:544 (+),score=142.10 GCRY01005719.1:135-1766(+)
MAGNVLNVKSIQALIDAAIEPLKQEIQRLSQENASLRESLRNVIPNLEFQTNTAKTASQVSLNFNLNAYGKESSEELGTSSEDEWDVEDDYVPTASNLGFAINPSPSAHGLVSDKLPEGSSALAHVEEIEGLIEEHQLEAAMSDVLTNLLENSMMPLESELLVSSMQDMAQAIELLFSSIPLDAKKVSSNAIAELGPLMMNAQQALETAREVCNSHLPAYLHEYERTITDIYNNLCDHIEQSEEVEKNSALEAEMQTITPEEYLALKPAPSCAPEWLSLQGLQAEFARHCAEEDVSNMQEWNDKFTHYVRARLLSDIQTKLQQGQIAKEQLLSTLTEQIEETEDELQDIQEQLEALVEFQPKLEKALEERQRALLKVKELHMGVISSGGTAKRREAKDKHKESDKVVLALVQLMADVAPYIVEDLGLDRSESLTLVSPSTDSDFAQQPVPPLSEKKLRRKRRFSNSSSVWLCPAHSLVSSLVLSSIFFRSYVFFCFLSLVLFCFLLFSASAAAWVEFSFFFFSLFFPFLIWILLALFSPPSLN